MRMLKLIRLILVLLDRSKNVEKYEFPPGNKEVYKKMLNLNFGTWYLTSENTLVRIRYPFFTLKPSRTMSLVGEMFSAMLHLCLCLGRQVGRRPLNSHPETGRRTTMCEASVALAIERSAAGRATFRDEHVR